MCRSNRTILVVDDDVSMLRHLNSELRDHGYRVKLAKNGQQALTQVLSNKPNLILTGIHMLEMNGYQLTRATKRLDPELPVIMMTGFAHFCKFFADKAAIVNRRFTIPLYIDLLLYRVDFLLGFQSPYVLDRIVFSIRCPVLST